MRVHGAEPHQPKVGSTGLLPTAIRACLSPARLLLPRDAGTVGCRCPLGPLPHHGPWGAPAEPSDMGPRKATYRAGLPTGTDIHQQREGPKEPGARYPCGSPPSVMPPGWSIPTLRLGSRRRKKRKGKKGKQPFELSASNPRGRSICLDVSERLLRAVTQSLLGHRQAGSLARNPGDPSPSQGHTWLHQPALLACDPRWPLSGLGSLGHWEAEGSFMVSLDRLPPGAPAWPLRMGWGKALWPAPCSSSASHTAQSLPGSPSPLSTSLSAPLQQGLCPLTPDSPSQRAPLPGPGSIWWALPGGQLTPGQW